MKIVKVELRPREKLKLSCVELYPFIGKEKEVLKPVVSSLKYKILSAFFQQ